MIAWSIEAAIESGCFDKVMVSTDDAEIAAVARKYGADVPFMRPVELADDHAGTLPVIRQAIEGYLEKGVFAEQVCCIYKLPLLLYVLKTCIKAVPGLRSQARHMLSRLLHSPFPFSVQYA